jgi:hypothetical protein
MKVINLTSTVFSFLAVLAVFAIGSSEEAFAQFVPSESYFLTGNGFTITENELNGSTIGLTFSPADTDRTAKMIIKEGFLVFQDREYDLDGISGFLLRDGKYLRILGAVQDNQGNEISIRAFGKIVGTSADGLVYQLTGKIDQGNKRFSFHFVTKSVLTSEPLSEIIKKEAEIITEIVEKEQEPVVAEPTEKINLLILGDVSDVVDLKGSYKFNMRLYDEEQNPLRNIYQKYGYIVGANVTVQCFFTGSETEIVSISGQTSNKGWHSGFFNVPNNPKFVNNEFDVKFIIEYQGNTEYYNDKFFVGEQGGDRSMKQIKQ